MCGIVGIWNYRTGAPVDVALLDRMVASVTHRGPDDRGRFVARDGSLGIGMRRLSIIDLAGGHQPIGNEDSTRWIVFNGEVYNYRELRRELQDRHRFSTHSDTEVVLHAYEEWELGAFRRFNGMFGLAIYDDQRRELVLARDVFGIKPLYYHDDGQRLVFGSELRAILVDDAVPRRIDDQALDEYLTFRFVPSPRTLLQGVAKLAPGSYLRCTHTGATCGRYDSGPPRVRNDLREEPLVEELRVRLRTAVERQMVSDVPVGALLSGGVDSSVVVTLMQQRAVEPIHTFTVGFQEEGTFNELAAARETAERLGTHHHDVVVSAADYVGFWPMAVWHLEEPVVTPSVLPMYFVSRLAREHVKVVLTGQGADEPWGSYRRYQGERWAGLYQRVPASIRHGFLRPVVEAWPRSEGLKRAVRALDEPDPAERFARVYAVFGEGQKRLLYGRKPPAGLCAPSASVRRWQQDVADRDGLAQMMYVDCRFSLSDDLLMYGDKISMAVSLEARVPMLDLELMAFVESLPTSLRVRGRHGKYLLRQAVTPWLPSGVLKRPKRGFDTPMDRWLAGDLAAVVRALWFGPNSVSVGLFDRTYLDRLLKEHRERLRDHRRQIFSLVSFEIWYQLFVVGRAPQDLAAEMTELHLAAAVP